MIKDKCVLNIYFLPDDFGQVKADLKAQNICSISFNKWAVHRITALLALKQAKGFPDPLLPNDSLINIKRLLYEKSNLTNSTNLNRYCGNHLHSFQKLNAPWANTFLTQNVIWKKLNEILRLVSGPWPLVVWFCLSLLYYAAACFRCNLPHGMQRSIRMRWQ